jgi:hypothetical protein
MLVIAMVTPALGERATRVQVGRRTTAQEVRVTPVRAAPAIPALVGMVTVAQRHANSLSRF